MPRTITLTSHQAIRNWVQYRQGQPAIASERNARGQMQRHLAISIHGRLLGETEHLPMAAPCSWDAWLAELDRQKLALKVTADDDDDIQTCDVGFIRRDLLN